MSKGFRPAVALLLAVLWGEASASDVPSMRQITEQFQDWTVACVEQKTTICEARHAIADGSGGVQAQISLSNRTDDPDTLLLQIALPLMADLKRKILLQVNDDFQQQLDYSFCNPAACFVAELADRQLITAFRKGLEFTLRSRNLQNGEVALQGSLLGFSAALNRISVLTKS